MNPTILEASDDLTNLSHLNEPAGMPALLFRTLLPPKLGGWMLSLHKPLPSQSCKQSGCAIYKKRYTRTAVLSSSLRTHSPGLILSTCPGWSRCMLESRELLKLPIFLRLLKRPSGKPSALVMLFLLDSDGILVIWYGTIRTKPSSFLASLEQGRL